MSDDSSLEEIVVEETTDRLDVSAVLGEGSLEDEIDADEIGAAAGARLGERIGRSLGEEVGGAIQETLSTGIEQGKGFREMLADMKTSVVEAIADALRDVEGASGIVSTLRGALEDSGVEESLSEAAPTDALESGADALEEATGGESETAEEESEEAESEEAESEEPEAPDSEGDADGEPEADEESGPDAGDLEDLRRETLEDFLGVMSYEDLQSVAKEVGVKANLSREEMTDRIVETVTDGADSSEESSDEETSDSEESAGNESQSDGEAA